MMLLFSHWFIVGKGVFIICSGLGIDESSMMIFHIVFSNDSHFHLLSVILIFSVSNWQFAQDNNPKLDVMGQDLIDDDFSESGVNVDVPLRNTNNEVVKSNKCNQCNYASSHAGHFRTHLKTHSGEKSNKCNQCDFASSQAGNLRKHLKTHTGEKSNKCNQCHFACSDPSSLRRHMKRHSPV